MKLPGFLLLFAVGFVVGLFIALRKETSDRSGLVRPLQRADIRIREENPYKVLKLPEIELIPKRTLKIRGDFNGDGSFEKLTEYYFDTLTHARIDSVSNDERWPWQSQYETETWLVSSDKSITPLRVPGNNSLGLLSLINLGDANADSLDEIALVINHTDLSNMNTCIIYQYCNHTWKRIYDFSIHEGCFIHTEDFDASVFETSIPEHLEKRGDFWYYYDYAKTEEMVDENGAAKMMPLHIRKKCLCESDAFN